MFLFSGGCPSAYIKQSLFIHSTSGNGGKPVKKIPASATVLPTMKVEVQSPYNRISISHNRKVSEADMETTNVSKLIAVTKKYTRIDELTPEILNAFVDKIVIHEREKKDGKRTQQIDIYYSYVGIVDSPTDEEMREMEREYMQRTTRQTA